MKVCPVALKYAKQVEDLVAKGMPFEQALRKLRPHYASEVKKIRKQLKTKKLLGGTQ